MKNETPSEKRIVSICDAPLTQMSRQIALLYVEGKSHKEIARIYGCSEQSVKNKTAEILEGTRARSLQELVVHENKIKYQSDGTLLCGPEFDQFNPKQRQIIKFVAQGLSDQEIGKTPEVNLTVTRVKLVLAFVYAALEEYGIHSRNQLIVRVHQNTSAGSEKTSNDPIALAPNEQAAKAYRNGGYATPPSRFSDRIQPRSVKPTAQTIAPRTAASSGSAAPNHTGAFDGFTPEEEALLPDLLRGRRPEGIADKIVKGTLKKINAMKRIKLRELLIEYGIKPQPSQPGHNHFNQIYERLSPQRKTILRAMAFGREDDEINQMHCKMLHENFRDEVDVIKRTFFATSDNDLIIKAVNNSVIKDPELDTLGTPKTGRPRGTGAGR